MNEEVKPGVHYTGISTPFYCNDGNGLFVMHRRSINCRDEQGRWDFGSGSLDFGQEPDFSVLRELREEYGIEGTIQEQLPAHSLLRIVNQVQTHWLIIPYFVLGEVHAARIMEPHKADEIGIFTLNNLPSPLHTGVELTMKKFASYFDKYRK